ncbi:MAG TPA: hypothetical protein VKB42_12830, partial [Dongiaceae bacterium]|nr:hypothetical protein [Dongiaceae bacterium]
EVLGEASAEMAEAARRAAGLASNNLEVALTRALQEPVRRHRPRLEAAMAAASTLRRLAGPVSILHHGAQALPAAELGFWQGWRDWAAEAFAALEHEERPPSPPPGAAPDPLARLAAQIELLDGALGRFWQEV